MERYLETERMILRSAKESDAESICGIRNSDFVQRYNLFDTSSPEDVLNEIGEYDIVVLEEKSSGAFIGIIHIKEDYIRYHVDSMELAGWLREDVARCGFMSEALRCLMPALFDEGLERLTAKVFSDNVASIRLMESVGFVREGYLSRAVKNPDGKVYDMVLFSVSKDEYYEKIGG